MDRPKRRDDPGVIVHRRDPAMPATPFQPILHLSRPAQPARWTEGFGMF